MTYCYLSSSVAQSCGNCWAGFVGFDRGAANTPCYPTPAAALAAQQIIKEYGDFDVGMKSCAVPDCSGHGYCAFFDSDSDTGLSACGQDDITCEARCVCDATFTGGRFCELNAQEAALQRSVRASILEGVAQVIDSEFPTADAVQGWVSSLVEASRAADHLSGASAASVLNMTRTIFRSANAMQLPNNAVSTLLASVDSATSKVGLTSLSVNDSATTLQEYAAFVSSNLLPGQVAVQAIQSEFRLIVAPTSSGSVLILPQDPLAQATGKASSSFVLPATQTNSSSSSAVVVSLISLKSGLYRNRDEGNSSMRFQSNPLLTEFSSWPCQSQTGSACEVIIVLQNSRPVEFQNRTMGEQVNMTCRGTPEPYSVSHICHSGAVISFNCSGGSRRSTHTLTCPPISTVPSCRLLLGRSFAFCRLTHFTSTNTTCVCALSLSSQHSRRLQSASVEDDNSSTYSLSVVNMMDIIVESAQGTILSAQVSEPVVSCYY